MLKGPFMQDFTDYFGSINTADARHRIQNSVRLNRDFGAEVAQLVGHLSGSVRIERVQIRPQLMARHAGHSFYIENALGWNTFIAILPIRNMRLAKSQEFRERQLATSF